MKRRFNLTPLHRESHTQRRINNGTGLIGATGSLHVLSTAAMDILIFACKTDLRCDCIREAAHVTGVEEVIDMQCLKAEMYY